MWNLRNNFIAIALAPLLSLAWASPSSALEASGQLQGTVQWQGQVLLKETVQIAADAVLKIAAGTVVTPAHAGAKLVVQGQLTATGSEEAPIVFPAVEGWKGIEFVESRQKSLLQQVRFAAFETAISAIASSPTIVGCSFEEGGSAVKLLRESHSVIEGNRFTGNRIGVDVEMKSAPTIRGNTFSGHSVSAVIASNNSRGLIEDNTFEKNKQGVGIVQKYQDRIIGNRFIGNGTGIYCNQTQNTPLIADNVFKDNDQAVVNFSFSYPKVENNSFVGNRMALRNDQFGSSLVVHNLFRGNGTALYNYRKSNAKVTKNVFEKNDLALFCDFSSYPEVKQNNFLGNKRGVELGIYQSADWEKRSGSKGIVMKQARDRGSKNPLLSKAPTEFTDFVDVSGNWWGADTPLLKGAGEGANLEIFYDRLDKETASYEDYGPGTYVIDWVKYAPWLEAPVKDAGQLKR